jgi:hypothetical protein
MLTGASNVKRSASNSTLNKIQRSLEMRRLHVLPIILLLAAGGCASEDAEPGRRPGVKVDTDRAPDLDPRTDSDIDVTPPDIDVDVNRKPGQLPDVDVDVLQPRDTDTKANEAGAE